MSKVLGLVVVLAAFSLTLAANPTAAPEIDAASGSSAVALIAGVMLMIRGRRK
jgi:hypothetical protein